MLNKHESQICDISYLCKRKDIAGLIVVACVFALGVSRSDCLAERIISLAPLIAEAM